MRIEIIFSFLLLISTSSLADVVYVNGSPKLEEAICISCSSFLSDGIRPDLEKRALSGDLQAAKKVANHYVEHGPDQAQTEKWVRLAAKLGDVVSQNNLALSLSEKGDYSSCLEAMKWLMKAKAGGSHLAEERLSELKCVSGK